MTQRIILFNGPPRSGKDTAALSLYGHPDMPVFQVFDRMSMPIKRAFAAMMAVNIDWRGNVEGFESRKEEHNELLDTTYRMWQIEFSERFMKPHYGENIFARLFVNRQHRQHKDAVIFIPDCGFDVEYWTLVNAFGPENVLVVKIYRPGTDYKSDSRSYLKVGSFGYKCDSEQVIHITNDGTEDQFKAKVLTRVGRWLNREELPAGVDREPEYLRQRKDHPNE